VHPTYSDENTLGNKTPEFKELRRVYLQSLDISVAIEQALKMDHKAEQTDITDLYKLDLLMMQGALKINQDKMERVIVDGCGGEFK